MAKMSAINSPLFFFIISSLLLIASSHFNYSEAQPLPPLVKGLSFTFYSKTCPKLETIVRNHLKKVFKVDNGQAPGLLRIMFHDCFVSVSKA
jgi:peroxidase